MLPRSQLRNTAPSSKFFTGSPTDRAIWLTIGGIVAILAGATSAMLPARTASR
jgi:hypothetical protein